jgi:hypothetical protein
MGRRERARRRARLGGELPGEIRDLVAAQRTEPALVTAARDIESVLGSLEELSSADPDRLVESIRAAIQIDLAQIRSLLDSVDVFDAVRRLAFREVARDPEVYTEPLHDGLVGVSHLVQAVAVARDGPIGGDEPCTAERLEDLHTAARRVLIFLPLERLAEARMQGASAASTLTMIHAIAADLYWGPPAWYEERVHLLDELLSGPGRQAMHDALGFDWDDVKTVTALLTGAAEVLMLLSAVEPGAAIMTREALLAFPAELAPDARPIDRPMLDRVLDWLATPVASLDLADLHAAIRHLRQNPVLTRGDEVCCPHPDLIMWAVVARLEADLVHHPKLFKIYERHRRLLVEAMAVDLLSDVLKPELKMRNAEYEDGAGRYEIDGILLVGDALVVVEAKGALLSSRAWSGFSDRLKRDLDERTVGEGSRQIGRLIRHLRSEGKVVLQDQSGRTIELESNDVGAVYGIVALLDELGSLVTDTIGLGRVGVDLDLDALPCVAGLHTLKTLTELLDRPWSLLHYLHRRRATFARHDVQTLEELDLVMYYLGENLYFDNLDDPSIIQIGSQTDALDAWDMYSQGMRLTPAPKPVQPVPTYVRRLLDGLAEERPQGWVEATCAVLDFNWDGRRKLDRHLKDARRLVRNDGLPHDLTMWSSPDGDAAEGGLTIVLGSPGDADTRRRAHFLSRLNGLRHDPDSWVSIAADCSGDKIRPQRVVLA